MTRVPITSPLAVLTTRTTLEHLMTTHSTTDLKPGDIVQHPEWGPGLVGGGKQILYLARDGFVYAAFDPDGWERVETVRPGHVQVRIDDLELGPSVYETEGEFVSSVMRDFPEYSEGDLRLIYRALVAQRAESTPPADEKPTNATVTLPCPDCGEAITRTAQVWTGSPRTLAWVTLEWHTCPPAQPDEPQEFGARIVVTDGLSVVDERWCRQHDGYWANEDSELMTWAYLCQRGTVTLGWDE